MTNEQRDGRIEQGDQADQMAPADHIGQTVPMTVAADVPMSSDTGAAAADGPADASSAPVSDHAVDVPVTTVLPTAPTIALPVAHDAATTTALPVADNTAATTTLTVGDTTALPAALTTAMPVADDTAATVAMSGETAVLHASDDGTTTMLPAVEDRGTAETAMLPSVPDRGAADTVILPPAAGADDETHAGDDVDDAAVLPSATDDTGTTGDADVAEMHDDAGADDSAETNDDAAVRAGDSADHAYAHAGSGDDSTTADDRGADSGAGVGAGATVPPSQIPLYTAPSQSDPQPVAPTVIRKTGPSVATIVLGVCVLVLGVAGVVFGWYFPISWMASWTWTTDPRVFAAVGFAVFGGLMVLVAVIWALASMVRSRKP